FNTGCPVEFYDSTGGNANFLGYSTNGLFFPRGAGAAANSPITAPIPSTSDPSGFVAGSWGNNSITPTVGLTLTGRLLVNNGPVTCNQQQTFIQLKALHPKGNAVNRLDVTVAYDHNVPDEYWVAYGNLSGSLSGNVTGLENYSGTLGVNYTRPITNDLIVHYYRPLIAAPPITVTFRVTVENTAPAVVVNAANYTVNVPNTSLMTSEASFTVSVQPEVVNVAATPSTPLVGSIATVTATVTNLSSVPAAGVPVYFTTNRFSAPLSGLYETPPNLSAGTGALSFQYNPSTMQLTYNGIVSGLGSNVTAAHIHTGTLGVPGGVLTALSYVTTTNGAIFSGTATLNAASEALLYNGGLYVNVHTSGFPGGEVRGQILEGVFSSILTGDQQVPPVSTTGTGAVYFTYNTNTGLFDYTGQVAGLSSNVTAAHIHTGTVGSTGGVIVPLSYITVTNGAVFSGSFTLANMAALVANFQNGLYVNVHTVNHSGGEVRGQILVGLYVVTDQNGQASIPVTSNIPGTVTVTAIAGNARGSTAVTFVQSPSAGFVASAASVKISQPIAFTNTTTGTEPLSYVWDFGDTTTSTLPSPTHIYTQAGTYTVTLTASNPYGTDSASLTVVVNLNQLYLPLMRR
ncbi:MAG TPA: CHRD domain-containing protein, partial [Anaerolineae bacterium]|nr:CHRD domain-containing protein [Anaerolineae bacterium]